jgi:hypothetical protein
MITPDLATKHPGRAPAQPQHLTPTRPAERPTRAATVAGDQARTGPPEPTRHHPALLAEQPDEPKHATTHRR